MSDPTYRQLRETADRLEERCAHLHGRMQEESKRAERAENLYAHAASQRDDAVARADRADAERGSQVGLAGAVNAENERLRARIAELEAEVTLLREVAT